MKKIVLFFLFIALTVSSKAQYQIGTTDSLEVDSLNQTTPVESINLTGNLQELVIAVGFPDRPLTQGFPQLTDDNVYYPVCGIFEDGTLLSDYIASSDGSIDFDEWYKPAFDKYFTTQSGGVYNVSFNFLRKSQNQRFITKKKLTDFGSGNNIVWNKYQSILNDVAEEIWNTNNHIFDNISCIHFTFEGLGDEFHTDYGGTAFSSKTLKSPSGQIFYQNKPITINKVADNIIHERMHVIGAISGFGATFIGFPDRGSDIAPETNHHNLGWTYDIMEHDGLILDKWSLYNLRPISPQDLIFLGWIKPEEILEINFNNYQNFNELKLADINYTLTTQQLNEGLKRVVKVMIHENFAGDLDEYFLIVNHKGTEFDKAFCNLDEYPDYGYNKGILIWHIKEMPLALNQSYDNAYDIEVAIAYNGFYGNPIPNDNYPRDYSRPIEPPAKVWNGQNAEDYDYLDDQYLDPNSHFKYLPDGGRHTWETTVLPPHTWYPPDPSWFYRSQSMRSDFFTDEVIKERVSNKFSDNTRPSSKDWGYAGNPPIAHKTHICIQNIHSDSGNMLLQVKYNYWEGEINYDDIMTGDVVINSDVIIPASVTVNIENLNSITFLNNAKLIVHGTVVSETSDLVIPSNGRIDFMPGSILDFRNKHALIVYGILNVLGTPTNKVTFDFEIGSLYGGEGAKPEGIKIYGSPAVNIQHAIIKNAPTGLYVEDSEPGITYTEFLDCANGIYLKNCNYTPGNWYGTMITNCSFHDNINGLYLTYSSPYLTANSFIENEVGVNCSDNSSPFFGELTDPGVNYFYKNSTNVYSYLSTPVLGVEGDEYIGGYNTFEEPSDYHIVAEYMSTVMAENNCWMPEDSRLFKELTESTIDYSPSWDCRNNAPIVKGNTGTLSLNKGETVDVRKMFLKALKEMRKGKKENAKAICKKIIKDFSDDKYLVYPFELLFKLAKSQPELDSLMMLNNATLLNSSNIGLRNYSKLISAKLSTGNYVTALNNCISNSSSDEIKLLAMYRKFVHYFNSEFDSANAVFNEIASAFPDAQLTHYLSIMLNGKTKNNLSKTTVQNIEGYLIDNYPNPFNPVTVIRFNLPQKEKVSVTVFDMLGKEIKVLVDEIKDKGLHEVEFFDINLASGIYFVKLQTNSFIKTQKIVLMK